MANQGKTVLQLPVKTNFYDANDGLVFVYGYDSANSSNNGIAQSAIIPWGTVITQAIANGNIGTFPAPLVTANIAVTSAQIGTSNTSPVTIVAAQGANTVIVPVSVVAWGNGTVGWSGAPTLTYTNTSGPTFDGGQIQNLLAAANSFTTAYCSVGVTSWAQITNKPIVLTTSSSPSGGNTGLTGIIQYYVLSNMP